MGPCVVPLYSFGSASELNISLLRRATFLGNCLWHILRADGPFLGSWCPAGWVGFTWWRNRADYSSEKVAKQLTFFRGTWAFHPSVVHLTTN